MAATSGVVVVAVFRCSIENASPRVTSAANAFQLPEKYWKYNLESQFRSFERRNASNFIAIFIISIIIVIKQAC